MRASGGAQDGRFGRRSLEQLVTIKATVTLSIIDCPIRSAGSRVIADDQVIAFTEPTGGREVKLFLARLFTPDWRGVGSVTTGCRPVNIVCPVLNLLSTSHSLGISFLLEIAELPRQEPSKDDSHEKLDEDDTENEDQREVEQDVRRHTTNRFLVNETDPDSVDKTICCPFQVGTIHEHGNVFALEGLVGLAHGFKERREFDLGGIKPLQEVEVNNRAVFERAIMSALAPTFQLCWSKSTYFS